MAKKNIKGYIKLMIIPGGANPSPPVGPALGQKGVNIMEFCKAFNAETQNMDKSVKVPVNIIVFDDRSFEFRVKTPVTSGLILREIKASKGSSRPPREVVGELSRSQLEEIARIKMPDLNVNNFQAALRTVAGTAQSMGIKVQTFEEEENNA